jgi:xylulokinase
VDVFREMGVPVRDMMVTGGGAKSPLWRQMLADLYGCPVSIPSTNEGAALGAAILAGVGAGVFANLGEACGQLVGKGSTLAPDPARAEAYQPYFALYKKLYLSLKDDFKALSRLV